MRKENAFRKVCYVVVNLRERREFLKAGKSGRNNTNVCIPRKAEYITIAVTIAKRIHLFPFRTQKLSSFTPKVLTVNRWEDR